MIALSDRPSACARVCPLRRFDFEHEGKKRPVGRAESTAAGFSARLPPSPPPSARTLRRAGVSPSRSRAVARGGAALRLGRARGSREALRATRAVALARAAALGARRARHACSVASARGAGAPAALRSPRAALGGRVGWRAARRGSARGGAPSAAPEGAGFGDEGNRSAVRVSFREAPEHRARPLAGAIRQVEEPVALVAGAAELWSGEGQPCRRRRDRAPIGGSPRIKSGGGHGVIERNCPGHEQAPASTAPGGGGV